MYRSLASFLLLGMSPLVAATPGKLLYNEDIQPILSEHCFLCHGPDPGSRKGDLRLDRPEFAFAPHKDGVIIAKGDPDHSLLISRIESQQPTKVMPPPEAHKELSAREIATLRRWIAEGAQYQEHWAFIPPVKEPLPSTTRPDWGHNEIDRFIQAGLTKAGLTGQPEADRYQLLRRVTFDLTGLPPTPDEIAAFANDRQPGAYERLVDRLLGSPHFGEQRAHYWLDAVRYGDTNGEHADNFRSAWPYRDYVIRAYNSNKPFDRFIIEQLAGDLLPPDNLDPLIASEFNRLNTTTNEGGTVVEEVQLNKVKDRTQTAAAVFLGLTVGCAACHDHKFDPLTQKDFYSLSAFFNNMSDAAFDANRAAAPPIISVPDEAKLPEANRLLAEKAAEQRKLLAREQDFNRLLQAWVDSGGPAHLHPVAPDRLQARFRMDEGDGAVIHNSAPGASPAAYTLSGIDHSWGGSTRPVKYWTGLRFGVQTALEAPNLGDFDQKDSFSASGWFLERERSGTASGALLSRMSIDDHFRGWDLYWWDTAAAQAAHSSTTLTIAEADQIAEARQETLKKTRKDRRPVSKKAAADALKKLKAAAIDRAQEGFVVVDLINDPATSAIRVRTKRSFRRTDWLHLAFSYDGSSKAAGVTLFVNGEKQEVVVIQDNLHGSFRTPAPFQVARRTSGDVATEVGFQDLRLYGRRLSDVELSSLPQEDLAAALLKRPAASWKEDERKLVHDFFFERIDIPSIALRGEIARLDRALTAALAGGVPTLVSQDRDSIPVAFLLNRGSYDSLRDRLDANVPAILPQLPPDLPHNRLGLAQWLVSRRNPLTARVSVNRMWQELFGMGLVETVQDFGTAGARPSNRPLLDWLAVDFQEHGWDVKRLYRQMALSAAYRQSARVTPAMLAADPVNRLVSRGPRFRMDGEMIRDQALAASGLLVDKVGGASVKPYQPDGIWEAVALIGQTNTDHYEADQGPGLYRRSLYTIWKRTAPNPILTAFDAPQRMVCTLRRDRTDTPLQALATENAPDFLEASRQLAAMAMRLGDADPATRIDYLGLRVLDRPLNPRERQILLSSWQRFQGEFPTAEGARAFLANGATPVDASLPPQEFAAWTLLASELLNCDQALNK